jgi:hypothetical protein
VLTNAQIVRMRAVALEALPGTAVIYNNALTSDSGGGYTEAFTPRTGGTVACRVSPLVQGGSEGEEGDRIEADAQYIITLPATTTVETDDRIAVAGITYNVVVVRDRSWEITRRVEVKKVV